MPNFRQADLYALPLGDRRGLTLQSSSLSLHFAQAARRLPSPRRRGLLSTGGPAADRPISRRMDREELRHPRCA